MQAWKDIENFLHGDHTALHTNRQQHHHQQLRATSCASTMSDGVEDEMTLTHDYVTWNNQDIVDLAAAPGANMFPGHGSVYIPGCTDTTSAATIQYLGHDSTTVIPGSADATVVIPSPGDAMTTFAAKILYSGEARSTVIPSHADAIIAGAGNAGTNLLPGHGEVLTTAWDGCFTPPVSPRCAMSDVYDDFSFIMHHPSDSGAAMEQHGSAQTGAAPLPLHAFQQTYFDDYYPPDSEWYGTCTYDQQQRLFQDEPWTATCDCSQCRMYPSSLLQSSGIASQHPNYHALREPQQPYSLQPDATEYPPQFAHHQSADDIFYDVGSESTYYGYVTGVSTPPVSPTDLPAVAVTPAATSRRDTANYGLRFELIPIKAARYVAWREI